MVWLTACWRRRGLRRILLGAAIVAALCAILYCTSGWWLPAAGRWLDVGESPRASDYCLVLSGSYESRPFAAAALFHRGFIRRQIWLTHTAMGDADATDSADANNRARRILSTLGIPPDRVVELPGPCRNTFDEAEVLARAMADHPTATVNVVTSNYHTRRARWIIRRVLGSNAERIRYISVPTDYYDAGCWWKVETGFSTYLKEFSKNIFYLLWYGWGGVLIVAIVAAATLCLLMRRMKKRRNVTPNAVQ